MEKPYKIRNVNWKNTIEGIPKDFLDVMGFFNKSLKEGKFPYVPRKNNPITKEEILTKWVPSKDNAITYVAEDKKTGKIIASVTMFLNKKTKQSYPNVTKNPSYKVKNVGTELIKKVINETLSRGFTVSVHTSILNKPAIKVMEKLGYGKGKLIKNFKGYRGKINSKNNDVLNWTIYKK